MRKKCKFVMMLVMAGVLTGCGGSKAGSEQTVNIDVSYERLFDMFLLDQSNYQVISKKPNAAEPAVQEKKSGAAIKEDGISADLDCRYEMCEGEKEELDTLAVCVPEGRFYYATSEGALIAEGIANADISDRTDELSFRSSSDAVTEVRMILEDYAGLSLPDEVAVYGLDQAYCETFGEEAKQECYVIWFGAEHQIQAVYSPEGVELIDVASDVSGTK